ncbi:STAS domain-containing protein [Streptomyces sp. NPDC085463]|uniref:STAS domain-containing protein n=2 Tax=Streptomyces TaxID=1883 RepID=UPI0037D485A9
MEVLVCRYHPYGRGTGTDGGQTGQCGGLSAVTTAEGVRVVTPSGEVDRHTGDLLRQALDVRADAPSPVVADMEQVTFMDSGGVDTLVTVPSALAGADGRLPWRRPRPGHAHPADRRRRHRRRPPGNPAARPRRPTTAHTCPESGENDRLRKRPSRGTARSEARSEGRVLPTLTGRPPTRAVLSSWPGRSLRRGDRLLGATTATALPRRTERLMPARTVCPGGTGDRFPFDRGPPRPPLRRRCGGSRG